MKTKYYGLTLNIRVLCAISMLRVTGYFDQDDLIHLKINFQDTLNFKSE